MEVAIEGCKVQIPPGREPALLGPSHARPVFNESNPQPSTSAASHMAHFKKKHDYVIPTGMSLDPKFWNVNAAKSARFSLKKQLGLK